MSEQRSITAPEIAAIRERLGKASAGPWSTNGKTQLGWRVDSLGEGRVGLNFLLHPAASAERYEDAEFIASARDDIPLLLDSLDAVTAERERLRAIIRRVGAVVEHTGSCYNCEAFGPPRCSRCTELLALVGEAAR